MDLKNYFTLKFRIYALRLECKMVVRLVKVGVAKRGVEKNQHALLIRLEKYFVLMILLLRLVNYFYHAYSVTF